MPLDQFSKCPFIARLTSSAGDGGSIVSIHAYSFTTATSWLLRSIAGRRDFFHSPMLKSKRTTKEESLPLTAATMNGRSTTRCLHLRSCRFALLGCHALTRHMDGGLLSKSKWMELAGNSTKRVSPRHSVSLDCSN